MNAIAADSARLLETAARAARLAAGSLARAPRPAKDAALLAAAAALRARSAEILAANEADVAGAPGLTAAYKDRLTLTPGRIEAMAQGLEEAAALPDPVGRVLAEWERPNGLRIRRVAQPLGVIGMIFESRPNVTADAAALCLKSGNAVILRGGSESTRSAAAIHACMVDGLRAAGLPEAAVQVAPTADRAFVGAMLRAAGLIDLIIPRGGKGLVTRVMEEARVPVLAHAEGLCHTYVHAAADPAMAREILANAKMRRTGVCGAAETLLIDGAAIGTHLTPLIEVLVEAGCEVRGSATVLKVVPGLKPATEEDWSTEYLDAVISVAVVDGISGAIDHIQKYSSNHTEAVLAENPEVVERFFTEIDSAILLHNASTQFADGGEFGMGAEIGIATGKMHARGPVGVEQLTSFKYRVRGHGQTRP